MIYFEQFALDRWTPCTAPTAPAIKNGREKRNNGETGRLTRGVCEVLPVHEGLTLAQLQAAYGVKE